MAAEVGCGARETGEPVTNCTPAERSLHWANWEHGGAGGSLCWGWQGRLHQALTGAKDKGQPPKGRAYPGGKTETSL